MKKREKIMEYVFLLAAVISIVAVALICIFLFGILSRKIKSSCNY